MTALASSFECQEYSELDSVDDAFLLWKEGIPADWCFQLKYDGIWAKIVIDEGVARIWSKTGQLKYSFRVPEWLVKRGQIVLVGEYMFGSQWAQRAERVGKIFVFDCLVHEGCDVSTTEYALRKKMADGLVVELGAPFQKVDTYEVTRLGTVWGVLEQTMKYEGIIVRKRASTYFTKLYKLKTEVEDDYVVMCCEEGEGKHILRLGSITVGQVNKDGRLVEVMKVGGGFSDVEREQIWARYMSIGMIAGKVVRV